MVIGGFQKLTLIDYPGKPAAIVFTQGCLFRCSYCHNPELIPIKLKGTITEKEVLEKLEEHRGMIDGVCITGGEPTMQSDLPDFIDRIKKLGLAVKLDTNGTNPIMLEALLSAKLLDYIAMDIKHVWDKYERITNNPNANTVENCKKSFALITLSGVPHEFRTTVLPSEHTEKDIFTIVSQLKPGTSYYLQELRFGKTLDPAINRSGSLNLHALADKLRFAFPNIPIAVR